MNNINFRNAVKEDFDEFNEIFVKTTYLGCPYFPMKTKSYEDYMKLVNNEEIILMESSEKIIGYSWVTYYSDGECNIKDIYILKEFQNKGFGRQFVEHIEQTAKKVGMEYISLMSETMETDRVWESLGYCSINYSEEYRKNL